MKVTYIHHSSFLVECEGAYLLFDYFKGELPRMSKEKPLYVFSSHRHYDHFSEIIFEFEKDYPKIQYILSNDIQATCIPQSCMEKTILLGRNETEQIADMTVTTLRSTDEGVAFLITIEGKTIYHAGDLNDWTWLSESEEWNNKMRNIYRNIVDEIRDYKIDVAFLPLDGRQESEFYQGIDYFLKSVSSVNVVFPMHFWEDYSLIEKLKKMPESSGYRDKIFDISHDGQEYVFEN